MMNLKHGLLNDSWSQGHLYLSLLAVSGVKNNTVCVLGCIRSSHGIAQSTYLLFLVPERFILS